MNKAVQAVSVFAASHIFFCDTDRQQCLTAGKGVAMAMTVAGVLMYSAGKTHKTKTAGASSTSGLGMPGANTVNAGLGRVRRLRDTVRREQPNSEEEGEMQGLLDADADANQAP